MKADLAFINGEVITVDEQNRVVECVAVKGNQIISTGTYNEIKHTITKDTQIIDLEGKSLLPGFIDAHVHFTIYGTNLLGVDCDSSNIHSIQDLLEAIEKKCEETPKGQWVRATGFNEYNMAEQRYPTRDELDRISKEHPIIIIRTCNHFSFVNSKALEVANIDETTKDPNGGIFERHPNGKLTGKLIENAHMQILEFANYTPQEIRKGLQLASKEFIKAGITSVHDAGAYGDGADTFRVMQEAVNAKDINVRIYAFVCSLTNSHLFVKKMSESGAITGLGNKWFKIGPAKLFTDGASVGPTIATRESYTHDPNNFGLLYYSQEELNEILGNAHAKGFQLTAHAQGDLAIEMLLDCFEKALKEHPRENHRHRIEHAGIASPDLQRRMKELGVVPIPNPAFIHVNGEKYREYYGDRVNVMYPCRDYIDHDIIAAYGSDAPVIAVDPLLGIHAAVNRQAWNGQPVGEQQKVNVLDAIRGYTINGAYASFEENLKGSIEVGKLADFVMLNDSILEYDKENIKDLQVILTVVDGEILYDANSQKGTVELKMPL
ncbi:amidohydrolase [Sutcliffiella cohnii]|uniref:amidohydrolase n=1 Tax=Sutcliffiella cohnii TaxID=33932 RepID=UPI002E1C0395|nr:amidohydrolase [Sutcliffiella cohnii]